MTCGNDRKSCSSCSSCGYGSMSDYCGCSTTMAPVPSQVPSMATVVVPVFGAISYDTLSHGAAGCEGHSSCGYYTIEGAYSTDNCGAYTSRSCGC